MNLRQFIFDALNNNQSKYFVVTNVVIGLFALASLVLALASLVPYFHTYESDLFFVDWVTTIFFTVEYALRFWVAKRKWAYVRSPLGLIDLFSFIPTYLGPWNFGFLKAARFLRIARLSRVANLSNAPKVLPRKRE